MIDGVAERYGLLVGINQDLGQAGTDQVKTEERRRGDKCEKVAVVAPADAVVEPHTVVVLGFYAVVAKTAMVGARRAPDIAGFAVFGWDFHSGCRLLHRLDQRPVVSWWREPEGILILGYRRKLVNIPRKDL